MHLTKKILDDVAVRPPDRDLDLTLTEVGLENVQMLVTFDGQRLPARGAASVSLIDRQSRGIHMSRLFKVLTDFHQRELDFAMMNQALDQMLTSQGPLSDAAYFEVAFDLPVARRALLSDGHGWRTYPVTLRVENVRGQRRSRLTTRVLYSSTCPCSAGVSRQALQDMFKSQVTDQMISAERVLEWLGSTNAATPHSQRSEAHCVLTLSPDASPRPTEVIDRIESALGTPVQTAVKREDEQEFARLNAQNLMFCEDAARRLKAALAVRPEILDFAIEVRHFESLHPHDVVAKARKFDGA